MVFWISTIVAVIPWGLFLGGRGTNMRMMGLLLQITGLVVEIVVVF